jgi:hypothetical protein
MAFAGHSSMKTAMRYLRPLAVESVKDRIENIWK